MKGLKHIVFRLVFLTTLFFCLGLEASAHGNAPHCNVEFPATQNSEDTNVFAQDDSFEDDHLNLIGHPYSFDMRPIFNAISIHSHSPEEHSVSSWKPPKFA
jgi:hypothetical protein